MTSPRHPVQGAKPSEARRDGGQDLVPTVSIHEHAGLSPKLWVRCPECGELIVVPIDVTAGSLQDYVEDCPVCCHPNVIHVELDDDGGEPRLWAEAE